MNKMADTDDMVLVRVKSASHPSCEDVEFTCDPKLTSVRQVKEKIRTLYSFHPVSIIHECSVLIISPNRYMHILHFREL